MPTLYDRIIAALDRTYDYIVVEHAGSLPEGVDDSIQALLDNQKAHVIKKTFYDNPKDKSTYLVIKIALLDGVNIDIEGLFASLPPGMRIYHYENIKRYE